MMHYLYNFHFQLTECLRSRVTTTSRLAARTDHRLGWLRSGLLADKTAASTDSFGAGRILNQLEYAIMSSQHLHFTAQPQQQRWFRVVAPQDQRINFSAMHSNTGRSQAHVALAG